MFSSGGLLATLQPTSGFDMFNDALFVLVFVGPKTPVLAHPEMTVFARGVALVESAEVNREGALDDWPSS